MKVFSTLAVLALCGCVVDVPETSQQATQQLNAPNAVTQWQENAQTLVAGFSGRGNAGQAYTMALIQIAVYDAVVAIQGGYEPFIADISAPPGADLDAAIATAAYRVGITRVNMGATIGAFQTAYMNFINAIPNSQSKADGIAVGEAAAQAVLAARASDNFYNPSVFMQPPNLPGVWQQVTMANDFATAGAADYSMRFVTPMTAATPDARRAPPPASMFSIRYALALLEVQLFGRRDNSPRTAAMKDAVQFWTESGFTLWQRNVRQIVTARGLDELEAARVFAATSVALGDALLACFESKYHYLNWRPWQAIDGADLDGNFLTHAEHGWIPAIRANHPEYPSGHGCAGGAMVTALDLLFGDFAVDLSSTGNQLANWPVVPSRHFDSLDDIVTDTKNARVWAGLHFRTTMNLTAHWISGVAEDTLCGHFGIRCDHDCPLPVPD